MTPPIADSPELLTPAWLTAALRTSDRFGPVVIHEIEQQPVGTGQMCDSLRLTLRMDGPDHAPRTVIAKLPAADETSRATARTLRSYENEVRFYQQLATGLPVRTPVAYYADIDPATASFVLLLEDLSPAVAGDQLAGCTRDQAEVAVAELVKLHAPRWGDPALDELEWLHRDPVAQRAFMLSLLPSLWEGFQGRYADRLGADVQSAGIGRQGLAGRRLVARPKHDDVAAAQAVAPVQFGEPAAGPLGDKVGLQIRRAASQAAADNLFDLAFMQINARTEHGVSLGRVCGIFPPRRGRR